MHRHNSVIRCIVGEYDILLIDQENLVGKNLRWFEDMCHLSEKGTDKFIENILNVFLEKDFLN